MHNKNPVKLTTKTTEELEVLAPKQYVNGKSKVADIKALNIRLFL